MAKIGESRSVAVSFVGKLKTTAQMIAILILLGADDASWLNVIGDVALVVAAGLTFWSMVVYLKAAWPVLRES